MPQLTQIKKNLINNPQPQQEEIFFKTHKEAVYHAIEQMDIVQLEALLDDKFYYLDQNKKTFISLLQDVFDILWNNGNTHLKRHAGKCKQNCYVGANHEGFTFLGHASKDYIALIFTIKNDEVVSIAECHKFKNENENISKNSAIRITSLSLPF